MSLSVRRWKNRVLGALGLLALTTAGEAQLGGVDTTAGPRGIAAFEPEVLARWSAARAWLRTAALPDPASTDAEIRERAVRERAALEEFSRHDFEVLARVRWANASWESGVRPGGGKRVPTDLREAYRRAKGYAVHYGANVGGFEFENEPDIGFVEENPETYAAFLKACYLGVKAGASEFAHREEPAWKRFLARAGKRFGWVPRARQPWVAMAPLALPPGPYFEQLAANGLFGYTDVFNYHYYGYAEDFSDVYRQFGDAAFAPAARGGRWTVSGGRETVDGGQWTVDGGRWARRRLPVMLSEFGYGRLGENARDTVDGRVRQWAWFRDVAKQIRDQRIAAPIAFRFRSTLERGLYDFGLTRDAGESAGVAGGDHDGLRTGAVVFRPADFGAEKREPWMNLIGQRFGGSEATPALAWLTDYAERNRYRPRDWKIAAPTASPVVVDFVGRSNVSQRKRYNGYLVMESIDDGRVGGDGEIVVYNFSDETVRGRLQGTVEGKSKPETGGLRPEAARRVVKGQRWTVDLDEKALFEARRGKTEKRKSGSAEKSEPEAGGLRPETGDLRAEAMRSLEMDLELEPMGRVTIPVRLELNAERFAGVRWALRFEPESHDVGSAHFSTLLFPSPAGMKEAMVRRFDHLAEDAASNRRSLTARSLAGEEPKSTTNGRWLVTPGVTIEDDGRGRWRFVVGPSVDPARQRVMAELPLADDFSFPDEAVMRLRYRLAEPAGTTVQTGKYLEIYFRTANGNLYVVWPWCRAIGEWTDYFESKANYTMMFHGRAKLPWRFDENRPVALVLGFQPEERPLTFEVRDARVAEIERPPIERALTANRR